MAAAHVSKIFAVLCAAGSAVAQNCIWNQITPAGGVSPSARYGAAMAYDSARGRVVLFGGAYPNTYPYFGDTWEWDGTAWTLKATTGPAPRLAHAMAYHPGLSRTILYGGTPQGTYDTHTWQWDGTQWSVLPGDNPLYQANGAAMVFDSANQRMILYGGHISNSNATQTRELSSNGVWNVMAIDTPSAYGVAAAYDSDRGRIVLCTGYTLSGLADVWEFDGAGAGSWTLVGQAPRRLGAAMAYDPVRHRMVMVGGNGASANPGSDAWEYDGETWTLRADDGPAARVFPSIIYDTARSALVYFGGCDPNIPLAFNDMWRFDGANTQSLVVLGGGQVPLLPIPPGSSASLVVSAVNATGYQWSYNGVPLSNGGIYSGVTTSTLSVSSVDYNTVGPYTVTITGPCGSTQRSFTFELSSAYCYANCDQCTCTPILTANDFQCFLNQFAMGLPYANCDGSTTEPVLNANDFQCYLNKYAQGCS